jgi:hypothetical protein
VTVARTRSFLYQLARFLGDYQAKSVRNDYEDHEPDSRQEHDDEPESVRRFTHCAAHPVFAPAFDEVVKGLL